MVWGNARDRVDRAPSLAKRACLLVAAVSSVLSLASCDSVVPKPETFNREAQRISDNLNKPVPLAGNYTQAIGPNGAPIPLAPGQPQPYIVGAGTTGEDLFAGVTDQPVNVELRFDDAEIGEVATTILGDILKKPYVVDTTVRGRVSLRAPRNISQHGLLEALRDALGKVGGEIHRSGGVYRIGLANPGRLDDPRVAQLRATNTTVSFVPLRQARASTVNDLLKAIYPGTQQQVTVDESHNMLVISGPEAQRTQMASTAELLDVDGMNSNTVAVYPLSEGSATGVAEDLRKAYQAVDGGRNPVDFVPLNRANSVLVIARQRSSLARVNELFRAADRQRATTGRRMYVVQLQHARAQILASVLRESLGIAETTATTTSPTPTINPTSGQPMTMSVLPTASATPGAPAPSPILPTSAPTANGGGPNDNAATPWDLENIPLRVVAAKDTNSLLIFATASEFGLLRDAIRRLDAMPLQVLIEATIMDVVLNDQLQFGVQAFLQTAAGSNGAIQSGITANTAGGFANIGPTSSGFNFVFASAGQVQAAVNALKAVTHVNVLSSPQVVTVDNQPAKLEVGQQVPITTQTLTQSTTNTPAIINSISYVQTGVILNVTPRVNSTGGVDLDIRQEVTDAPPSNPSTPSLTPVLTRRVIETRVSVQSTQTVALGGLILENTNDTRARTPLLGDIPVVGWLFGQTSITRQKEELLVFLTPTVFSNPEEARTFSLDLRRRLDSIWSKPETDRRQR